MLKLIPFTYFNFKTENSKSEIINRINEQYKKSPDYDIKFFKNENYILVKRLKYYDMKTNISNLNILIKIESLNDESSQIKVLMYLRFLHWVGYLFFSGLYIYILLYSELKIKYIFLPFVIFLYLFGINSDGLNSEKKEIIKTIKK